MSGFEGSNLTYDRHTEQREVADEVKELMACRFVLKVKREIIKDTAATN